MLKIPASVLCLNRHILVNGRGSFYSCGLWGSVYCRSIHTASLVYHGMRDDTMGTDFFFRSNLYSYNFWLIVLSPCFEVILEEIRDALSLSLYLLPFPNGILLVYMLLSYFTYSNWIGT